MDYIRYMKSLIAMVLILIISSDIYGQTIEDIKKKLGVKGGSESKEEKVKTEKGFKQAIGKYNIVQVKDISREEAESILKHMDRLMEEFIKLHEYPFGTHKCYVIIYGIKEDFDRVAKTEKLKDTRAFSYKKGINHYAVTYYDRDLYPTLSHEAFHLFIENIFKGDVPYWLNEGMACYYETCAFVGDKFETNRISKRRLAVAKDSFKSKEWPEIKNLIRLSYCGFYGRNSHINYSASWSLIYYLKNKNEAAFKNFLNDLILGKSFSTSIRRNYGIDIKDMGKDWLSYIEKLL